MEHHTTHHKRIIAATPDPNSSMDPTLKKLSNKANFSSRASHSTSQKNPDSSTSSKPFYYMTNSFSRLNLYHNKARSSQKHINPATKDIRLQAKALTLSADSDSSKFVLVKPSKLVQPRQKSASRYEKDGRIKEESSEEMMKKSSKGALLNSKKKEVYNEEACGKQLVLLKDKDVKNLLHEGQDVKRVSVSLGRRRSFCGSQVELAGALANCGVKVVSVDMPPFMQIHAVDFARKTYDSLEKFTAKTLALTLKKLKAMRRTKAKGYLTNMVESAENDNAQGLIATPQVVKDLSWYMDSGATDHVVTNLKQLDSKVKYTGKQQLQVGSGDCLPISHTGV